jgi:hypothetical protein
MSKVGLRAASVIAYRGAPAPLLDRLRDQPEAARRVDPEFLHRILNDGLW